MDKRITFLSVALSLGIFFWLNVAFAQVSPPLDYGTNPVVDQDLDGLTDLGEEQVYKTDKQNPDSDGDGYFDGIEVKNGSDPLNGLDVPTTVITREIESEPAETPWAWYISRASGLIGFVILYVLYVFALVIRIPGLKKYFLAIDAIKIHCFLSIQAIAFALIHGVALMFDKYIHFSLADVFVPFASDYEKNLVTLGILSFYIMIILTVSSYLRSRMSYKFWRVVHYLNIVLFVIVFLHALFLGTDLKEGIPRAIFIYANVFLAFLILLNISFKIHDAVLIRAARKRASLAPAEPRVRISSMSAGIPSTKIETGANENENIRPSGPKIV